MKDFYDELKIGDTVLTRETKHSPWYKVKVIFKESGVIRFENKFGIEITSYDWEVNEKVYYKELKT